MKTNTTMDNNTEDLTTVYMLGKYDGRKEAQAANSCCSSRLVRMDAPYGSSVAVNVANVLTVHPVKSHPAEPDCDICEVWFRGDNNYVTVAHTLDEVVSLLNANDG